MPAWEMPQLVQPTMVEANFSLVVNKGTRFMRNMMSLDVDTLRMGRRGFCSRALTGDRNGAKAGSTTAGATSVH